MNSWMIAGIILLIGFFICLILILRSKWLQSRHNIKDYEVGRDKLTYRKKKEPIFEEESSYSGGGMLSILIVGFIVILIGCSLAIMDQVNSVTNSTTISAASNVTSSSAEILSVIGGIISIFFALAIATTAILIAVSGIRNMGSV